MTAGGRGLPPLLTLSVTYGDSSPKGRAKGGKGLRVVEDADPYTAQIYSSRRGGSLCPPELFIRHRKVTPTLAFLWEEGGTRSVTKGECAIKSVTAR